MLVLMVGSILAGSLFGVRYTRIEKERQLKAELEGEVLKEEVEETT
jgi:hypothetical protein